MFDKAGFSLLLEKALGDRKTTEYANQSGVNRTYISKLLNKKLDNPPSPEILKKLAEAAHNNVSYDDLMEAAGYIKNKFAGKELADLVDEEWREAISSVEFFEFYEKIKKENIKPDELIKAYKFYQLMKETMKDSE